MAYLLITKLKLVNSRTSRGRTVTVPMLQVHSWRLGARPRLLSWKMAELALGRWQNGTGFQVGEVTRVPSRSF